MDSTSRGLCESLFGQNVFGAGWFTFKVDGCIFSKNSNHSCKPWETYKASVSMDYQKCWWVIILPALQVLSLQISCPKVEKKNMWLPYFTTPHQGKHIKSLMCWRWCGSTRQTTPTYSGDALKWAHIGRVFTKHYARYSILPYPWTWRHYTLATLWFWNIGEIQSCCRPSRRRAKNKNTT